MCFDSDFSMDPNESNDGSQGAFTGGNIPPYQAAWNPYMYGYQAPPSWFPQGEQQVPPNVSMVRPGTSKVFFPDRLTQTAGHRFRFTGPVGPVTGGNRLNSNPNSKAPVQPVPTGLPAGLTGLPVGLTGLNSNPNSKAPVQSVYRPV